MLKKEWLEIRAMKKRQLLMEEAEEEIVERIKKLKAKDNENKLVLKEEKVYIPKDESLRLEIIW